MGLKIFKPQKISININANRHQGNGHLNVNNKSTETLNQENCSTKVNGHLNVNNKAPESLNQEKFSTKENGHVTSKIISPKISNQKNYSSEIILDIIRQTYEDSENSDPVNDNYSCYTARSNKRRAIRREVDEHDDNNIPNQINRVEFDTDIKLFTDIYSMEDLIEYLSECSNCGDSPISSGYLSDEDLQASPRMIVLEGSKEHIKKLSLVDLKSVLLDEKVHLELSEKPDYFDQLVTILNIAVSNRILSEVIDIKDPDGNAAISIALLNSNVRAFYYLLMKLQAHIPLCIYRNGERINFLHHIALNGKIMKKNVPEYLLVDVLHILVDNYPKETIDEYLCDLDNNRELSLPHLLLTIYQSSYDLRNEIVKCLQICIQNCPKSIWVLCSSYLSPLYKFNLIAHAILLPDTNPELIELLMRFRLNANYDQLYRSLVRVHQNPEKEKQLLQLIH